jgi:hypothetical protein
MMAISVDRFLDRMPRPGYNCLDFTREVWLALTGQDITERLTGLVGDFACRKATVSGVKGFKRLQTPSSPCFVVMQRTKFVPHIGIFLNGRMLHMSNKGVQYMPIEVARAYFTGIRYYQWQTE